MICALIIHQSESLICTTYTGPSGGSIVDCFNIAGNLSYRHIGAALHADLSFDLSFDEDILNNLDHWLICRPLEWASLFLLKLCLCGILPLLPPTEALRTCYLPFYL